jgi:hypothetical protein
VSTFSTDPVRFPCAGLIAVLLALATSTTAASRTFDHSAFDALLRAHVVDGMVDYGAFARAPTFAAYLKALDAADLSALDEKERLALWINAYNAYTIQLINAHGERDSIRNINRTLGLALKGPWHEKLVKVGGRTYHLDNVEHDIIRKEFQEPRIHFALVCAAMGCPPLRSEAYTGAKLEGQLDDQARRFLLRSPAKNRVDVPNRTVYVSSIFNYYRDDFGGTDAAVGRYLARFYPAGSAERRLLESGPFKIVETDYDWTLNSQEKAARKPS